MKRRIILGVIMLMLFTTSTALAENRVYFEPSDIIIPDCTTKTVLLKLDSTDGIAGFQADIKFDPSIVMITNVEFAGNYSNMFSTDTDYTNYYRLIGVNGAGDSTGDQTLATITLECVQCDIGTSLEFSDEFGSSLQIANFSGGVLSCQWENGEITCGNPDPDRTCLGDCVDANGELTPDMSCSECLNGDGVTWINYPCTADDCGCTCDSMEWEACPECCDGVDNDNDGATDMDDPKCGCCIDGDETNGENPCPPPCIPELPTLAFMSIGILGMFLLVRKRG